MTKNMMYRVIFLLLLVSLYACKRSEKDLPVSNALTFKLNNYLKENADRLKLAGLTVSVTRNDSIIYAGAFGVTNVNSGKPMQPTNFFHWASVSKTFVAMSVMQLVEQGKIKLDEKLITYLPYFKQKEDWYKDITIRQMLNHTSGIGDVDDYEWDKPQYDDGALERFVRSIKDDKMLFKPGTDWQYSNSAYETLGAVIAKVSGMPFETYVKKNILEPLDMGPSTFIYPDVPDSLRVSGHEWALKPVVSDVYPFNRMHGPSSTLNTSVIEITKYAIANLHRGTLNGKRVLNDSTYNILWTNSVALKDKPEIGAAWWIDNHDGIKTYSHTGGDTGFRSLLMLIPDKNMSISVACNYELIRTKELGFAILDIILGKTPQPAQQQIGFAFADVMARQGLDSAKAFYAKTNADSLQRKYYFWAEDDGAIVYPGYLLLDHKMYKEAIDIFKFNLERFPESAWAFGHLGVAYSRAGEKALAKENLQKAIKMVPEEEYFKEELKGIH